MPKDQETKELVGKRGQSVFINIETKLIKKLDELFEFIGKSILKLEALSQLTIWIEDKRSKPLKINCSILEQ